MRPGVLLFGISVCLAQAPTGDPSILESARSNALDFTATLPDFMCDQVIDRTQGTPGASAWRSRDQLSVKLRYLNGKEEYRLISLNHRPTGQSYESVLGAKSRGEFGSWLSAIFDPETAAAFVEEGREKFHDRAAAIFSYRVAQGHSHYDLSYREGLMPRTVTVGYHGRVFIDLESAKVMRVEIRASELPANFPLRESSIVIEYGFSKVGGHEFLLPSYAETRLVMGRVEYRNQIEFRNYGKFEAQASVCFEDCGKRGDRPAMAGPETANIEMAPRVVPIAAAVASPARAMDMTHASAEVPFSIRLEAPRREHKLVTFEVAVLDGEGQPVRGLTAEDFHVEERGAGFQVALCRASDAAAEPEPEPPAVAGEEYSNRGAQAPSGVRVILLDTVNPAGAKVVRRQIGEAIGRDGSDERLYLYLLTAGGLEPVRALPRAGESKAAPTLGAIDPERLFPKARNSRGEDPVYRSLRWLASSLAAFPGRKSIVWITHGTKLADGNPYEAILAMQRARVAIYPVTDARRDAEIGGLRVIASATGGRVHLNTDIEVALRDAAAESQSSYTVGYYPAEWDGRIHNVRISSTRSGVRVVAPDSYFAEADRALPVERERAALRVAALNPLDAGEIGMQVAMTNEKGRRRFDVRVNARDVWFYRQGEEFDGSLAVAVVGFDREGRMTSSPVSRVTLDWKPEGHAKALAEGINLSAERAVDESDEKVRVVVFDRYSNAAGSVTIPVR
jgi:VWFA-related protein